MSVIGALEEVLDEWMVRAMVHFRWHYDDNTVFVISRLTGNNLDIETARQHQLAQWGLRSCRATGTESVGAAHHDQARPKLLRVLDQHFDLLIAKVGDGIGGYVAHRHGWIGRRTES